MRTLKSTKQQAFEALLFSINEALNKSSNTAFNKVDYRSVALLKEHPFPIKLPDVRGYVGGPSPMRPIEFLLDFKLEDERGEKYSTYWTRLNSMMYRVVMIAGEHGDRIRYLRIIKANLNQQEPNDYAIYHEIVTECGIFMCRHIMDHSMFSHSASEEQEILTLNNLFDLLADLYRIDIKQERKSFRQFKRAERRLREMIRAYQK